MTITHYDQTHRSRLETMLVDYFNEISGDIPEHIIRGKLLELLLGEQEHDIIRIAIGLDGSTPIGFAIYQIDSPQSDWCKRPGYGCIREFYIVPEYRRRGYGAQLAAWCEQDLLRLGAKGLYLTADDAIPFWHHCGYRNTDEICSNDLEILTK